jgi:hypothetical protein
VEQTDFTAGHQKKKENICSLLILHDTGGLEKDAGHFSEAGQCAHVTWQSLSSRTEPTTASFELGTGRVPLSLSFPFRMDSE